MLQKNLARETLLLDALKPQAAKPVAWKHLKGPQPYGCAIEEMSFLAQEIRAANAPETVWLLEHPSLLTAGTKAKQEDLLNPNALPVHQTGRGGEYTWHGPGQRIAYVMLDLDQRGRDIRAYVAGLEKWLSLTLAEFHLRALTRQDRVGVWIERPDKVPLSNGTPHEDKIAAIGVRVSKWVTMHGISLNVEPDLSAYDHIVPCGVTGHGVTSLVDLGLPVTMDDVDQILRTQFEVVFGPTERA